MLITSLIIVAVASAAWSGSPCPPREDLYPCSCFTIPLKGTVSHTIVSCHRLPNTESLADIFPTLRRMQIDEFYLYDSFWEARNLGAEQSQKLPQDWFTILRIKQIEIVDSTISDGFACGNSMSCRNTALTRFTLRNSSLSEKVFGVCDSQRGEKYSWLSCLTKLKDFHMINGKLTTIKRDFFPVAMRDMTTLNLTRNFIRKIDTSAFASFNKLKSLDLSHNKIDAINNVFKGLDYLELLDISWNEIVTLGLDFLQPLPLLKSLKAGSNVIMELQEAEWKTIPEKLRFVDLSENPLHCDCSITWINGSFHINVALLGTCATPEDYENSKLRTASRKLGERCDEDGNIGTRPPKVKTTKATH